MIAIIGVAAVLPFAPPAAGVAQTGAGGPSEEVRRFVAVDAPAVALVGVTVIDGTGGATRPNQTVVIRDGRIVSVGEASAVAIPDGAEVLERPGHTLIPGLVGLHDHLFYTAAGNRRVELTFSAPRLYLGAGVTTIRTTGSTAPYADLNLQAGIERGEIPGPRIHITAPYISGDADPSPYRSKLSSPEEARRFVAYWAEEGASWIKAYTAIRRAELAAAIEEAHRRGLKVTGHLCSVSFREAVALGIDNLEHGLLTASDFIAEKEPDVCPGDLMVEVGRRAEPGSPEWEGVIRVMVEAGVALTSTPAVYEPFFPGRPVTDERTLEAMAPEVRRDYLEVRRQIDGAGDAFPLRPEYLLKALAFERDFYHAGGLLAAGVDPTGIGGALPGFGDQRNYELLIEGGFEPTEAVRVMTLNGAQVLGVEGELGSVEMGKVADLVLLEGDLERDSSVIRNVELVFKDGIGFDADRLIASVRGQVGIR